MDRVQINNPIPRAQLQAVTASSDTFQGAPIIESGANNLRDLANALGTFNGALGGLIERHTRQQEVDNRPELQRQENVISKLSPADLVKVKRTGVLPDGTRLEEPKLFTLLGRNIGNALRRQRSDRIGTADITGIDVRQDVLEEFSQVIGEADGNPFVEGGLLDAANDAINSELALQQRQIESRRDDLRQTTIATALVDLVDQQIANGASPLELFTQVRGFQGQVTGPGQTTSASELDARIIDVADRIVNLHPEHAEFLLTTKRQDARTGQNVGALVDKPASSSRVQNILLRADKARFERKTVENTSLVHRNNIDRVLEGRGFRGFEDIEVNTGVTLSAREQERAVVSGISEQAARLAQVNNWSNLDRLLYETRILSQNNITSDFVTNQLGGIANRIGPDTLADPNQLQDITDRFKLYQSLASENPTFVFKELSRSDKLFYQTASLLQRFRGLDDAAAINQAASAVSGNLGEVSERLSIRHSDFVRQVRKAFDPGIFSSNPLKEQFQGTVIEEARQLTAILISQGINEDDAIESATEAVASSSVLYNGVVLSGLEMSKDLPVNLTDALDVTISDALEGIDTVFPIEGEVVPRPRGDGSFTLVDEDFQPIVDTDTQLPIIIHTSTIRRNGDGLIDRQRQLDIQNLEVDRLNAQANLLRAEISRLRRQEVASELRSRGRTLRRIEDTGKTDNSEELARKTSELNKTLERLETTKTALNKLKGTIKD